METYCQPCLSRHCYQSEHLNADILVLSTLCTGFKNFLCTFYYYVRTFTKLCTQFSKTSALKKIDVTTQGLRMNRRTERRGKWSETGGK